MSNRPKPYVGVSGVVSPDQQDFIYMQAESIRETGRRIALGVKAVHKTQWLNVANKYGPEWYPVGDAISQVIDAPRRVDELRVAQVFLDTASARAEGVDEYESRFVRQLMGRTARWLSAVQFDMLAWHEYDYSELFDEIKSRNENIEILLQCQGPIMEKHGPTGALSLLDRYEGLVDHVLFDASHGTGKEMDADALKTFVEEAAEREWLGIGVAGGLDAMMVSEQIPELLELFADLSFDAEGKLHVGNTDGSNRLNLTVTEEYLRSAGGVMTSTAT